MKLIQRHITNNRFYGKSTIKPRSVVLHSIATPQPKAEKLCQYYDSSNVDTAVHCFIDAITGDVYQTMPWTMKGAHAGKGGMNSKSIGIEMCESSSLCYRNGLLTGCTDLGKARMCARITYESAVSLTAFLCVKYNIKIVDIYSHSELGRKGLSASTHLDPEHLWNYLKTGYTMDSFRKDVQTVVNDVFNRFDDLRDIPEPYISTTQKLIDKGLLKGLNNGKLGLTRDMLRLLTIIDRAGVFDE